MSTRAPQSAAGAEAASASGPAAPLSPLTLSTRAEIGLVALLVLNSGAFFGLVTPQNPNLLAWPIAFVPMFLALDLALRRHAAQGGSWRGWALRIWACTYPLGVIFAMITGGWVVNTAHVYGGLGLPMAYVVTWFGYGTLIGMELCLFVGLPFALTWRRPGLALLVVPLWATVLQIYVPRFLFFTYGQSMYTALPLVQFADVLGSGGLNLLYLPLELVLYAWLRHLYAPAEVPLRPMLAVTAGLALLFVAAWGYGEHAMSLWARREAQGRPVELVGIQPNFSLQDLASNPALAYSDREESLRGLLADSDEALARAPREPGVPTVLLWPESVYPRPYFLARGMREVVEQWVRAQHVHLILTSEDIRFDREPDGRIRREAFGAAIQVGPNGLPRRVYHKISLIPWGETIPGANWIPGYRDLLHAWIPQISEFTPGRQHTVFDVDGVRIAPMICFDASNQTVAQGMAANGARLGVVLGNLAWFGRTSVSKQFGLSARFRAIENRMPILFLSQNGSSWLIDARGEDASPHLPQFERAAWVGQVRAPREGSFYSAHALAVQRSYLVALLLVMAVGWRRELLGLLRGKAGDDADAPGKEHRKPGRDRRRKRRRR